MDQSNLPYLFLDTCVVQMLGDRDKFKSAAVRGKIIELSKKYRMAISAMTGYENLHGLRGGKLDASAKQLEAYQTLDVTNKVLVYAALIGGLYPKEEDHIRAGDKIIGATVFLEEGFLITENHKDFPHPFFITEEYLPITYEIGSHYMKTIDLSIYKPCHEFLNRKLGELIKDS